MSNPTSPTPAAAAPAPVADAAAPSAAAPSQAEAAAPVSPDASTAVASDAPADAPAAAAAAAAPATDSEASLTIRALVSTKEAGVIIGKGGANVAELRERTGVKAGVSKVVQGVHDRVLSVSGTVEGVSKAYAYIAQTILENPVATAAAPGETLSAAAGGNFTSVRLLISHNLMGTVIGRQGLKIKHIQDVSGARMVASKEMLPQSTERIVEVQGTFEAIRVAVLEIAKCLLEDWERGQGTVLYHPGQAEGAGVLAIGGAGGLQLQGTPNRRAGGGAYLAGAVASMTLGAGGSHGIAAASPPQPRRVGSGEGAANGSGAAARRTSNAAADAAASGAAVTPAGGLVAGASEAAGLGAPIIDAANQRTQNISIPSDMVGCIIGKGGSKITEIRRISGSRISIAKVPHDDSGERMFTIQGTAEANEKALYLLYNQLESEKERRTSTVSEEKSGDAAVAA